MTTADIFGTTAAGGLVVALVVTLVGGFGLRRAVLAGEWPPDLPSDVEEGLTLPQTASWTSWSRHLLHPRRGLVALVWWMTLLTTVLDLLAPWPVKILVDNVLGHTPAEGPLTPLAHLPSPVAALVVGTLGVVAVGLAALIAYLVTVFVTALEEDLTCRLRAKVLRSLLTTRPDSTSETQPGELGLVYTSDTARVAQTCLATAEVLVPEGLLLLGVLVVTLVLDWRLTVVALAFVPVLVLTAARRNALVRRSQEPSREAAGVVASHAVEVFTRIPLVHLFGAAPQETRTAADLNRRAARAAVGAVEAGARFGPTASLLPGLGLTAAMAVGAAEVGAGRLTVGGLLVFLAYLGSLYAPVQRLTRLSTTLSRGTASRQRVLDAVTPASPATPLTPASSTCPGSAPTRGTQHPARREPLGARLEVEALRFRRDPRRVLFDRLDLTLDAGSTTCLTGPSGIGKSTLLALLARLVDPHAGRILIDGVDVQGLSADALRSLVAVVPQEPWLHSGSIRDNIVYGRSDLSASAVGRAVDVAGVGAMLRDLGTGLDCPVGTMGHLLSGGQQRRIALARALVRGTPLLLLDEPTTGLDDATADRVVTDLVAATADATVLVVTHDHHLTRLADATLSLHPGGTVTTAASPAPVPHLSAPHRAGSPAHRHLVLEVETSHPGRR